MRRVFSIGYHCRGELYDWLEREDVQRLIDVRARAWSPRASYAAAALSRRCAALSIDYIHAGALGNPFRKRLDAPSAGRRTRLEESLARYRDHLEANIDLVVRTAARLRRGDALMCACRYHDQCHRGVLLERVLQLIDAHGDELGLTPIEVVRLGEAAPGQALLFDNLTSSSTPACGDTA